MAISSVVAAPAKPIEVPSAVPTESVVPKASETKPTEAVAEKLSSEVMQQWQAQLQAQRQLEFSIDSDSGRDVVKVLDGESGDVIRQFPSEDVLKLARAAKAGKGGLFLGEA